MIKVQESHKVTLIYRSSNYLYFSPNLFVVPLVRLREPHAVASFWVGIRSLFCPEFFASGATVAV